MKFSKDELQYLLNAINTHIRANGLNVAAIGSILADKIQNAAKQLQSEESQNGKE